MSVPLISELQVVPVAGRDSMLLNLSGAHGPFFTRNIAMLKDNAGHTGVGEVPGGEKIRQTIEDARGLLIGQPIGDHLRILQQARDAACIVGLRRRERQDAITAGARDSLIGTTATVLVDTAGVARSHREAPEIDGVINVPTALRTGTFHTVKIVAALGPDLEAQPVESAG